MRRDRRSTTHTTAVIAALLLLIAAPTLCTVSTTDVPGWCVSACGGDLPAYDDVEDRCACVQATEAEIAEAPRSTWGAFIAWLAESGVAWSERWW